MKLSLLLSAYSLKKKKKKKKKSLVNKVIILLLFENDCVTTLEMVNMSYGYSLEFRTATPKHSGPSYSKLTTSLVNDSLKFT